MKIFGPVIGAKMLENKMVSPNQWREDMLLGHLELSKLPLRSSDLLQATR
jgi:hypothetical protein